MATIKSSTEHLTLNADGASKDIKFQANGVEVSSISSAGVMTATSFAGDGSALTGVGKVLQVVNYQTGAVATGTTLTADDDTIPQNTEGTEVMTLAITPLSASSKLLITSEIVFATSIINPLTVLLFRDTTADCLSSNKEYSDKANEMRTAYINHYVASGSTSATTFKIRVGMPNAGTVTFNGVGASRQFGGTLSSSITITEIEA